jgi:hypothetical protein
MAKVIEVVADNLQQAQQQARAQVPSGYVIDEEKVLSDGIHAVRAKGATAGEAFAEADRQIPSGARITDRRELVAAGTRTARVEAFTELDARNLIGKSLQDPGHEAVGAITPITLPKVGFLGLGRKAGTYEAVVTRQAAVEVNYCTQARISVTLLTEEEQWLKRSFDITVADRPGAQHQPVGGEGDLHVGDVIRIWHEMMGTWIPGWWLEVIQIEGHGVQLRDLMSGALDSRHIGDTVRSAYKHPDPKAAKAIAQQPAARAIEQSQRTAIASRAPRAIDLEALRIGRQIARGGRRSRE